MSPGLRPYACANWPRPSASACRRSRSSPVRKRARDGLTTPGACWLSLDRRGCRSRPCSIGPPTGSRAGCSVMASRRTMRCAMAATETAGLPSIVELEVADAAALCPLSQEAGWNQVAQDWRLMLTLGQGFGARGDDGRWIGSALTLPLGPRLAWISMLLVTKAARGRGLGTALLSAALAAAEASGRGAGLDATEFGRPIYLPLGFRDVFALARWQLAAPPRTPLAPPPGISVRAAGRDDLAAILSYDPGRSGFCRAAIHGDLASRSAGFAQVASTQSGALAGFVLGREGRRSWHIGPVVAEDEATALALLSTAAARLAQPLIVDVPERHGQVRDWLLAQGATAPRRFSRMLRGSAGEGGEAARIFALAGPELG